MLQEMRKFSKSWVANVFLGVLAVSFVSWGAGSWMTAAVDTSVAKVGGKAVDQQEFRRDYTNALRQEAQRRGQATLSAEEAKRLGIANTVLEQNITRVALENVAHKLGLTASDPMVTSVIHRYPAFAGLTGQFDRQTFQRAIERIGYSEPGFIELVREDIAHNQLVRSIEGGFTLPPGYAKMLFSFLTELRAADYIVVENKSLGAIPAPSDAELLAFVKAHPNSFSTPEYRDVTFAYIAPTDVAAGLKVSDDQIKAAYDEHKDEFIKAEKRDLLQLQFKSEAEAKAAFDKASKGGAFDQMTNAQGEKPVVQAAMSAEDFEASQSKIIFALPNGGLTAPMKLPAGGFALYKVTAIAPGATTTFDQAKEMIRNRLLQELAQSKLSDIANAYTDASSGGLSLTEAAKKTGLHNGRVAAVDASGLGPDGQKAAIPDDPDFRAQVFRAETGEEGDPQVSKAGLLFVVSVNGSTPPKLKPLDQVRAQALAAWTAQQQAILLKKKAQELTAQANRDGTLQNVAKAVGANVQQSPALHNGAGTDVFSAQLVTALFNAKPGETVFGTRTKSGDFVVARLTGINHPNLPDKGPFYQRVLMQLSATVGSSVTESYIAQQRDIQKVKYNTKVMNSVIGGEGP